MFVGNQKEEKGLKTVEKEKKSVNETGGVTDKAAWRLF